MQIDLTFNFADLRSSTQPLSFWSLTELFRELCVFFQNSFHKEDIFKILHTIPHLRGVDEPRDASEFARPDSEPTTR